MSPNRIVALLTPLVFAPLAGACAAWLAKHFPGINVDKNDLQSIFIAGALIALAPAAQWLHGWQKHEARQAEAEQTVALANAAAVQAQPPAGQPDLGDISGLEDLGDDLDDLGPLDELAGDFDDELLPEEEPSIAGS
jgi:hypothetical protein